MRRVRMAAMRRFTLRTLFVVVTLACMILGWIGWQYGIVKERRSWLQWVVAHGGRVDLVVGPRSLFTRETRELQPNLKQHRPIHWAVDHKPRAIPWYRQWLGDEAVVRIFMPPDAEPSDAANVLATFPEIAVLFAVPPG